MYKFYLSRAFIIGRHIYVIKYRNVYFSIQKPHILIAYISLLIKRLYIQVDRAVFWVMSAGYGLWVGALRGSISLIKI